MSRIQVDNIYNKEGLGSPTFPAGAVVTGVLTATTGSFTGDVSVGGTLTYQNVTNIDSVGMVTARQGVQVLADGINAVGIVTATEFDGQTELRTWLFG